MNHKQRVTDETFDRETIIGFPIADVLARTDLEWESCYPTVDESDMTVCRPGVVDANWANEWLGGDWHIMDDQYAVADKGTP